MRSPHRGGSWMFNTILGLVGAAGNGFVDGPPARSETGQPLIARPDRRRAAANHPAPPSAVSSSQNGEGSSTALTVPSEPHPAGLMSVPRLPGVTVLPLPCTGARQPPISLTPIELGEPSPANMVPEIARLAGVLNGLSPP